MQRRRIVSAMLCATLTVALCLAAAPKAALAANAPEVYIWGEKLDAATPYYTNGTNGAQGSTSPTEPFEWNARYNPSTGLLALNKLNVRSSTAEQGNARYAIYAPGDVTIDLLNGSSVSTQADENKAHKAVWIDGSLTFQSQGDEIFAVYSGSANQTSCGVWVSGGDLTVKSGKLYSYGGAISNTVAQSAWGNSYGVNASGVVTVEGGILLCEGGAIAISNANAHCASLGISSKAAVLAGGTLNAHGGSVAAGGRNAYSYGLYATGTASPLVKVSGGALMAVGRSVTSSAAKGSYGIFFANMENGKHLQYTGGAITSQANTGSFYRYGNAYEQLPSSYLWRIMPNDAFSSFPGQAYAFRDGQTYAELFSPAPAIHPTSPQTVDFTPGDTARLTVTAGNALAYQWQKRGGAGWVDIPSADGSSYTTPPLTEANDAERYRCVLSFGIAHISDAVESPVFTLRLVPLGGDAAKTPKTGDRTPLLLLCSLLPLSGAGIAAARRMGRQKRSSLRR